MAAHTYSDPEDRKQGDEALLERIRNRYRRLKDQWQEIHDEGETDMRYLVGDPWDEKDRKAREDAGRPCINHDELNQYCEQLINSLRQNKRGIKFDPAGGGANEKTAELRENHVRAIEYKSSAQAAYITAAENAIRRSYGFFRISRQYVSDSSFDQEIKIKCILNPDSVLFDLDCKEADWSDARDCFVLDPMPRKEFEREYPNAEPLSFEGAAPEHITDWITDTQVLVAEYWCLEPVETTLYLLKNGETTTDNPGDGKWLRKRTVQGKKLMQYLVNGKQILSRSEQPGKHLPIIPVLGKQMFLSEKGQAKRVLVSLVRLARDPQMSLAYLTSLEMEGAGLTPKAPYVGYKGQFESARDVWEAITKVPHAFAEADPIVDQASGAVLPLPRREPFVFDFASVNVAKDACRRAIQAAMGISPLPTAAQRQNEKSGVALQKIASQMAIGSFHFPDNFERALKLAGVVLDEWIPATYDTAREITVRDKNDKHAVIRINDPRNLNPQTNQPEENRVDEGQHEVTVTTGPSYESQREEAADFLDTLIANLPKMPLAPPQAQKLLALAIEMKQLGPKGDQMAEIISPDDQQPLPPQAQAMIAQAKQQVAELSAELQKLQMEKMGKVVETQGKMALADKEFGARMAEADKDRETKLAVAEISTKAQDVSERRQIVADVLEQIRGHFQEMAVLAAEQAHERAMQSQQQAHEKDIADQQAVIASQQSAQDAAQNAAAQENSSAGPA